MKKNMDEAVRKITNNRYFRLRLLAEGVVTGVFVGLVIAAFRYLLDSFDVRRPMAVDYVRTGGLEAAVLYFGAFVLGAWILKKIMAWESMTNGSGIPQIKAVLMHRLKMTWWKVLIGRFLGALTAVGMGLSMGRQGPSVQLGGCVGQAVGKKLGFSHMETRLLISAGSGAGLAAAFNAPLAGVIFCLEELEKNFSSMVLLATVAAAATATAVDRAILGDFQVFDMGVLPSAIPLSMYGTLVLLGIFIGLLGRLFLPGIIKAQELYGKLRLKGFWKMLLPMMLAAVLCLLFPEITGAGNRLVGQLVDGGFSFGFLLLLFLGKFLFTVCCAGSNAPGGLFLPMLTLGAVGGSFFAGVAASLGGLGPEYVNALIIFAMAAYFAAASKTPVTAAVLITEMAGSFQYLLPIIIVTMTASFVADIAGGKPLFGALLVRLLKNSGRQSLGR